MSHLSSTTKSVIICSLVTLANSTLKHYVRTLGKYIKKDQHKFILMRDLLILKKLRCQIETLKHLKSLKCRILQIHVNPSSEILVYRADNI